MEFDTNIMPITLRTRTVTRRTMTMVNNIRATSRGRVANRAITNNGQQHRSPQRVARGVYRYLQLLVLRSLHNGS